MLIDRLIDGRGEVEVRIVTAYEVKYASKIMKLGTTDVSGRYSNEMFCHAPSISFEKLATIFQSFLKHGTITLSILTCFFMPLQSQPGRTPPSLTPGKPSQGQVSFLSSLRMLSSPFW